MDDPYALIRFVEAQKPVYDRVRSELRGGIKRGHWMWFVFLQIRGLGYSPTSRTFAISSLEEAEAYLRDPILGPRLIECTGFAQKRRALIERPYSRRAQTVGAVYDRPAFFVQSRVHDVGQQHFGQYRSNLFLGLAGTPHGLPGEFGEESPFRGLVGVLGTTRELGTIGDYQFHITAAAFVSSQLFGLFAVKWHRFTSGLTGRHRLVSAAEWYLKFQKSKYDTVLFPQSTAVS